MASRFTESKNKLRLYYESVIEDMRPVSGGGPNREERAVAAKALQELLVEMEKINQGWSKLELASTGTIAKKGKRGKQAEAEAIRKRAAEIAQDQRPDPASDVLRIQHRKAG